MLIPPLPFIFLLPHLRKFLGAHDAIPNLIQIQAIVCLHVALPFVVR